MRGEIIGVWSETWREIWAKLAKHPNAPKDIFCELYRELTGAFATQPDVTSLADIVDDPDQSRAAFRKTKAPGFRGELALLEFMKEAHNIVVDLGGDPLANRYYLLTEAFLEKYSLRYDLRRSFSLNPTLPGVFTGLVRELKTATSRDSDLHPLMIDFEEALRDLGLGATQGRMKTCFNKQFNLLEAIASKHPKVAANTLGKMCDELNTWPHPTIREAAKKIYGFRSYPGVGHGVPGTGALRNIEMRDLIAVSVLLAGLSPYLTDLLDSTEIYQGN